MSAWSFSLPAGQEGSCPMATKDGICGSCYAQMGRYAFPNVLNAQWIRFAWVKRLLADGKQEEFISTMTDAIRRHVDNGFFRVHDSGDLWSPEYVNCWGEICKRLPEVNFWFPTRSWRATNPNWVTALTNLASLPNVSLRPSALEFDEATPVLKGYSAGTAVVTRVDALPTVKVCPKSLNSSDCHSVGCRACWSKTGEVAYLVHGHLGRHVASKISDKALAARREFKLNFTKLTVGAAARP